jgi:hypothetical protein
VVIAECERQQRMRTHVGNRTECGHCVDGMAWCTDASGNDAVMACRNCGGPPWFSHSIAHNKSMGRQ